MAHMLLERELGDVVLFDVVPGLPQGKALDLMEMRPIGQHDMRVTGTNDWADCAGSDLFIVTAGIARKPGMSRDDLIATNSRIMTDVAARIRQHAPESIVIVISNPLDAMVTLCHRLTGFPKARVIGMAGALDTARFRHFVADELGVSVENVGAFVLGGHGDDMVPLPRYCSVAGIPLERLLAPDRIAAIVDRTRLAGGEIVKLLGTGSAYFSPRRLRGAHGRCHPQGPQVGGAVRDAPGGRVRGAGAVRGSAGDARGGGRREDSRHRAQSGGTRCFRGLRGPCAAAGRRAAGGSLRAAP